MKRNGCPVAMETVEHRNFCGENASNFMAQVNFLRKKTRILFKDPIWSEPSGRRLRNNPRWKENRDKFIYQQI